MPTYEYTCQKCTHTFECVQSMTTAAHTVCPKELCPQKKWGRGKVKRGVGGGAGIIFKGSGFFVTDYRSEGYKTAAKQDSSAGSTTPAPATAPATAPTTAPASGATPSAKPAAPPAAGPASTPAPLKSTKKGQ